MVPDEGYLSAAHRLLKKHNALLIADEVKGGGAGWGFAFIIPDEAPETRGRITRGLVVTSERCKHGAVTGRSATNHRARLVAEDGSPWRPRLPSS